jgi:hypothetical protein
MIPRKPRWYIYKIVGGVKKYSRVGVFDLEYLGDAIAIWTLHKYNAWGGEDENYADSCLAEFRRLFPGVEFGKEKVSQ